MSMPMTPEEQPMPDRLWDSTSVRILKWLTTMEASEGVGAKQEQITIRMSTCSAAPRQHCACHTLGRVASRVLCESARVRVSTNSDSNARLG